MNTITKLSEAQDIARQQYQARQISYAIENRRRERVVSELKEELEKAGFTFKDVTPTALRFGTIDYPDRYFGSHHAAGVFVGFNYFGAVDIAHGSPKETVEKLLQHIARMGS